MENFNYIVSTVAFDNTLAGLAGNRRVVAVEIVKKTCSELLPVEVLKDIEIAKKYARCLAYRSEYAAAKERVHAALIALGNQGNSVEQAHEAAYQCFDTSLGDCLYGTAMLCLSANNQKKSTAYTIIEMLRA